MMKHKGVEYPVSPFKFCLADEIVRRLLTIKEVLGLKDNIEAFSLSINIAYNTLIAAEKVLEKKQSQSEQPVDYIKRGE